MLHLQAACFVFEAPHGNTQTEGNVPDLQKNVLQREHEKTHAEDSL